MTSNNKDSSNNSGICPELVSELAKILDQSGLTDLEVEKGDLRIKVSRTKAEQTILPANYGMYQMPIPPIAQSSAAPYIAAPNMQSNMPEPSTNETNAVAELGLKNAIKSPMVGTIYLAPAPDEPPFVKIGQQVSKGQTLLIVEAMKTMNHITAPQAGTIKAILVENTQPVEFDEPLVIIE